MLLVLVVALLVSCRGAEEAEVPATATVAQAEPTKAAAEPTKEPTKEPAVELGEAPGDENNIFATPAEYEAATGNSIGSFAEAPMLAELVESGDLPPVEDRLPNEPSVIRPKHIGQYGGEMRLLGFYEEAGAFAGLTEGMQVSLAILHESLKFSPEFRLDVAKDWELADDGKSLTVTLREGMKWSDGDDFNANDLAFWYEIQQDPELNPTIEDRYMPGGELMGLNVIDDTTVQFTFAIPYYRAFDVFSDSAPWLPEHYLKQYMPKYNDGAEALAKEEGFETWQLAFDFHAPVLSDNYDRDPTAPQINPWIIKELGADSVVWERNPYFFRVDAAGNQLPYVDELLVIMTADVNTVGPLKTMAGELDWGAGLALTDYPVLKEAEAQGDYTAYRWPRIDQSHAWGFAMNYTHKDPVLREIFGDVRFRQALSLAINRDEISEKIFLGLTEPWTAPVSAAWSGYEDWMGTYYAEHDVEKANALLDEMGLEWDDAQEYRLRPDGQTLYLQGEYCQEWLAYSEDIMDLVTLHWKDIGVQMEPKFVFEDVLQTRAYANETDMGIGNSDGGFEPLARSQFPIRLRPPWHWPWPDCCPMAAHPWYTWLDCEQSETCNQEDVEGVEPPEDIKRAWELVQQWLNTPAGTEEYETLINEVITINVENLWYFGTVSSPPNVVVIHNRMGNTGSEAGEIGPLAGAHHYLQEAQFIRQ
jgi:peptide/nickel transport system substrate-binding protein